MTIKQTLTASVAALSLVSLSACVTDPNTGEQKISRTAGGSVIGGALGYLLGDLIGGSTAARIIGAGIGGTAGAVIGDRFDDQIRELDELAQGTGVDVEELGDQEAILVRLPDGVTFATGSSSINANFRAKLDEIADVMVRYPDSLIDIYGHTDTTGSMQLNQRLSEQRADAVRSYLVQRGVSSGRIATLGYGETQLRVNTGDNVSEPLNRRVEIKITPISQEDVRAAQSAR